MARGRLTLLLPLTILALFLTGTVIVLSTISYYLAIDPSAYLTEVEIPPSAHRSSTNESLARERIPRIIHQTWKSEDLPDRWRAVSNTCRTLMPDYDYMLWTDASSRAFIAEQYPWFLSTFDGYQYNIQRADAIRYFVLHHYGGIYVDLDVGCERPLDPLLVYPVILPKTIPVGVSNDLMFSAKEHPFMAQTIHNLIAFDHNYFLNYPTVMFSTGPMYVSAQYGLYTASHPHRTAAEEVRILSKPLYGKNAKPDEAPHTFFSHHYGSSWHSDDAAFITFLGRWGRHLMKAGLVLLVLGAGKIFWSRRRAGGSSRSGMIRRRFARVDLLLPRGLGLAEHAGSSTSSMSRAASRHNRRRQHGRSLGGGSVDLSTLLSSSLSRGSVGFGASSTLTRGFGMGMASSSVENTSSSDNEGTSTPGSSTSLSPPSSQPTSPTLELPRQLSLPLLPLPFDLRSTSPSPSATGIDASEGLGSAVVHVFKRAGAWVTLPLTYLSGSHGLSFTLAPDSSLGIGMNSASSSDDELPLAGRRSRSDSTRVHTQGRAPPSAEATGSFDGDRERRRRRPSQNSSFPRRGTTHARRSGAGADRDSGSQSFIALLPAIFTSTPTHSTSTAESSSERERTSRMLSTAAEAKAREAGFSLSLPSTIPRPQSVNAFSGYGGDALLNTPTQRTFDLLTGSTASSSAGSSRAGTPSPVPFYAPAGSSSNRPLQPSSSTSITPTAGAHDRGLQPFASNSRQPLPIVTQGLHATRSDDVLVDLEGDVSPSPLLIDPLKGSDVRTTRSTSVGVAVGAPPPYRAATSRSTSLAMLGQVTSPGI